MPQAKTPQGPVASGTHCWLESGAVKWEREQEGRMGNEERRQQTRTKHETHKENGEERRGKERKDKT